MRDSSSTPTHAPPTTRSKSARGGDALGQKLQALRARQALRGLPPRRTQAASKTHDNVEAEPLARTDNDIPNEQTGQRRIERTAESQKQQAVDARQLASENALYRKINANVEQRTDDDITDEATGQRRVELDAASKVRTIAYTLSSPPRSPFHPPARPINPPNHLPTTLHAPTLSALSSPTLVPPHPPAPPQPPPLQARKVDDARELTARNAAMRAKREAVAQRTDDDITDEATGRRRVELAAASEARRNGDAATLAQQNAELRAKRESARQTQRTDDDITDEEAGALRRALAREYLLTLTNLLTNLLLRQARCAERSPGSRQDSARARCAAWLRYAYILYTYRVLPSTSPI